MIKVLPVAPLLPADVPRDKLLRPTRSRAIPPQGRGPIVRASSSGAPPEHTADWEPAQWGREGRVRLLRLRVSGVCFLGARVVPDSQRVESAKSPTRRQHSYFPECCESGTTRAPFLTDNLPVLDSLRPA